MYHIEIYQICRMVPFCLSPTHPHVGRHLLVGLKRLSFRTNYVVGKVSAGLNSRQTDSQLYHVRSDKFKVRVAKMDVRAISDILLALVQDKL
jgi:hypothetical protein